MLTLRHGQALVLDVESHLIAEDCADPQLVSVGLHGLFPLPHVTLMTRSGVMQIVDAALGYEQYCALSGSAQAVYWPLAPGALEEYLADLFPHCNLITHRGAFDFAVICATFPQLLPAVEALIDRGGVYDTRIAEARYLGVEHPEYATLNAHHPALQSVPRWHDQFACKSKSLYLDALCRRYGGALQKSSGGIGTRFAELENVPLKQWPAEAIAYCTGDLLATGYVQVQQCLNQEDDHPDAPVVTPGSWATGMLTLDVFRMHLSFCADVKAGKAVAWRTGSASAAAQAAPHTHAFTIVSSTSYGMLCACGAFQSVHAR